MHIKRETFLLVFVQLANNNVASLNGKVTYLLEGNLWASLFISRDLELLLLSGNACIRYPILSSSCYYPVGKRNYKSAIFRVENRILFANINVTIFAWLTFFLFNKVVDLVK